MDIIRTKFTSRYKGTLRKTGLVFWKEDNGMYAAFGRSYRLDEIREAEEYARSWKLHGLSVTLVQETLLPIAS